MHTETSLNRPSRIIGLTGGVGMGKTTVSSYLHKAYGLPILDADLYARQAVEPETAALAQIVERYGDSVLLANGALDRRRLGDILFGNLAERQWIEQLIHPEVRRRIEADLQDLAKRNSQTAVVVVPLLFEAKMTDLVTEIWVVQSSILQQTDRLRHRDQLSLEQIQARISSQMPIEQRAERADWVLDNSGSQQTLFEQVDRAWADIS
jgi:dephospho-CoA kinase